MNFGELIAADRQYTGCAIDPPRNDKIETSNKSPLWRAMGAIRVGVSIAMLALVIGFLAVKYDLSALFSDVRQLSVLTVCVAFAALFANALAATLRFKTIAADTGHSIKFRNAMAIVSTSTLAGSLFFQLAGQLIARGVLMGRGGIPFANAVVITAYERIISAILSALLGLAGAYYIFGVVYVDQEAGGADLIKIACGLVAATAMGAWLGYGRMAVQSIAPLLTSLFVERSLRVIGLTLLVQLPMMIAYVWVSKTLSPDTSIPNLIAASAVVMFAASVPISLGGWGLREMSAVAALGAIGVEGHAAFTAAVLIGAGSLLAMGVTVLLSLSRADNAPREAISAPAKPFNFSRALSWCLPLAAATLVLFQIYIPVGSGLLNTNLADPVAIVGGAFFVLNAIKSGELPRWRVPYVNAAIAVMTVAMAMSLLIGGFRFGWTSWAVINRFFGWFVLLSYLATGALAAMENGKDGLRVVLLTFVGATAAIAGIEVGLVLLQSAGLQFASRLVPPKGIETFSQNHNFLAFQLLMATSAAMVFVRGGWLRTNLLALFLAALWFAASRSGWIAATAIVGTSLYLGAMTRREVLTTIILATAVALVATGLQTISVGFVDPYLNGEAKAASIPAIWTTERSTQERMITMIGGLKLFFAHPVFGAGLGAFRNQLILATSGIPLVIHSTAIWLLAELGIIGFLGFTIPAVAIFSAEWRRAKASRAAAVIVLCFVAFAVMSAPADMLYQRTFWIVVGAALAVVPVASDRDTIGARPGTGTRLAA